MNETLNNLLALLVLLMLVVIVILMGISINKKTTNKKGKPNLKLIKGGKYGK